MIFGIFGIVGITVRHSVCQGPGAVGLVRAIWLLRVRARERERERERERTLLVGGAACKHDLQIRTY